VSKLKFKFKKTIKLAEFVHADLEYHEELSTDIIVSFKEEIKRLISLLPEEPEKIWKSDREIAEETEEEEDSDVPSIEEGALTTTDIESEEEPEEKLPKEKTKTDELKALFRKIAAATHPDKLVARGYSKEEITRKTKIFKKAKKAFDSNNWYILYIIAADLGIELPDPSEQQLEWLEEDIAAVRAQIAHICNLTAMHWHSATTENKWNVIKYYFEQVFGLEYPFDLYSCTDA